MLQVPEQIAQSIFRAYDIRGIVDKTLTVNAVYAISLAFGSEALAEGQKRIVVAKDGRLSADKLFKALVQGLMETGCEVIDIGAVPTPLLYFATHKLGQGTGVMLTGSHNPADHNGLKMLIGHKTLTTDRVQALYKRYQQGHYRRHHKGYYERYHDTIDDYINEVTASTYLNRSLKVVVDCGNGIAGSVAPLLLRSLGCQVLPLYCEVDGRFPNHHPDPAVVANMRDLQSEVVTKHADIGLALDGDGDRLGVVDDQGRIVWPDRYLMLLASQVLRDRPGEKVIFDVKCSRHLTEVITSCGGKPIMWKTGHSLLKMKLQQDNAPLAGELSGHVFFNDRWYGFDDGLYAGARLLELLSMEQQSLSELLRRFPDDVTTPELKLYVEENRKFSLMEEIAQKARFDGAMITTIDGLRVDFADGWGLVRPSNTTPCLVFRFEADDAQALERIQQVFREQLLVVDNRLELPF
jgi:phosphomannomutase/phosphoglucomutase